MTNQALLTVCLVPLYAGCGAPPTRLPGQDRAEELVWRVQYGRPDPVPTVLWRDPECWSGDRPGLLGGPTGCSGDRTWVQHDLAELPIPDRFSRGAFAHSLQHVRLHRDGLDPDPLHAGPDWRVGGEVWAANVLLDLEGM